MTRDQLKDMLRLIELTISTVGSRDITQAEWSEYNHLSKKLRVVIGDELTAIYSSVDIDKKRLTYHI